MRRRADITYVKTADGLEVDFHAREPGGEAELLQVCADLSSPDTLAREFRALEAAAREFRGLPQRMLVLTQEQAIRFDSSGPRVQPAYIWLLGRN